MQNYRTLFFCLNCTLSPFSIDFSQPHCKKAQCDAVTIRLHIWNCLCWCFTLAVITLQKCSPSSCWHTSCGFYALFKRSYGLVLRDFFFFFFFKHSRHQLHVFLLWWLFKINMASKVVSFEYNKCVLNEHLSRKKSKSHSIFSAVCVVLIAVVNLNHSVILRKKNLLNILHFRGFYSAKLY